MRFTKFQDSEQWSGTILSVSWSFTHRREHCCLHLLLMVDLSGAYSCALQPAASTVVKEMATTLSDLASEPPTMSPTLSDTNGISTEDRITGTTDLNATSMPGTEYTSQSVNQSQTMETRSTGTISDSPTSSSTGEGHSTPVNNSLVDSTIEDMSTPSSYIDSTGQPSNSTQNSTVSTYTSWELPPPVSTETNVVSKSVIPTATKITSTPNDIDTNTFTDWRVSTTLTSSPAQASSPSTTETSLSTSDSTVTDTSKYTTESVTNPLTSISPGGTESSSPAAASTHIDVAHESTSQSTTETTSTTIRIETNTITDWRDFWSTSQTQSSAAPTVTTAPRSPEATAASDYPTKAGTTPLRDILSDSTATSVTPSSFPPSAQRSTYLSFAQTKDRPSTVTYPFTSSPVSTSHNQLPQTPSSPFNPTVMTPTPTLQPSTQAKPTTGQIDAGTQGAPSPPIPPPTSSVQSSAFLRRDRTARTTTPTMASGTNTKGKI